MAEGTLKKKLITKVASEFQVSVEQIIEYLHGKGHTKIRRTSTVDEKMYDELAHHFKKELDQVEKRKVIKDKLSDRLEEKVSVKKLTEKETLAEKLSQMKAEAAAVQVKVESPKEPEGSPPLKEEVIEPAKAAEVPPAVEVVQSEVQPGTEAVVEPDKESHVGFSEGVETVSPAAEPPEKAGTVSVDTAPVVEEKKELEAAEEQVQAPPIEKENVPNLQPERSPQGLTIKGRIDLETGEILTEEQIALREQLKEAEQKAREAEKEIGGETQQDKKKKKKKKKKIREESSETVQSEIISDEEAKKRKKKKGKHPDVDVEEVELAYKRTIALMEESGESDRAIFRKKKRKEKLEAIQKVIEQKETEKRRLRLPEFVSVGELAKLMGVDAGTVISKSVQLGLMVSINQRLDLDTITLIADDFGFEVELQEEYTDEVLEDKPDPPEALKRRPPVVTIMGHVDHGKTSLLDFIRNSNVVAGEAGGITQHIGAYMVQLPGGKQITFLDTPGHEAFTAMRARGAQATDIVVLVVAADDNVMPQTIEAISHARAAGVPIVVAINKIDKPEANPDRIRKQLADHGVLVEEWGGKTQSVEISAKKGTNVDLLLEKILLEADLLDVKANPDRLARGVIIESTLDKGRGAVATVLVQKGSLKIGDPFVAGTTSGKVRAMTDERGNRILVARPSTPVQVTGFEELPVAGDLFIAVANEKIARDISTRRKAIKREQKLRGMHHITLEELSNQIKEGTVKQLNVVVKGDVDGSVEALSDALMKLSNDEVRVQVIHRAVGPISESDVLLASASNAVIIGFHVRPSAAARKLAEQESVEIKLYNIIYDAIDNVRKALEGMLSPEVHEEVLGSLEVRQIFKVPRVGTVAGCYVTEGKIQRNNKVRLIRDGIVIYEGTISSLKRFKDDVREVESGYECGLSLENFNDIKAGDIIEAFTVVETQRSLA
ncbi:MAG: translation initiation factor IF-2 [Candidatus Kryptoniota bacterium]